MTTVSLRHDLNTRAAMQESYFVISSGVAYDIFFSTTKLRKSWRQHVDNKELSTQVLKKIIPTPQMPLNFY